MSDQPANLPIPASTAAILYGDQPAPPPPPEPALPPMTPPPAGTGLGGGTALALSLLVSAGLGAAVFFFATNPPEPASIAALQADSRAQARATGTLRFNLDALSARLAVIEATAKPAVNPGAPGGIDSDAQAKLADQITALAARIDTLDHRPDATPGPAPGGSTPSSAPAASVEALTVLSDRLNAALAAAKQDQSQAANAQAALVTALTARLDKLEHGTGTADDAAARAVKLARLQMAAVALATGQKLGPIAGASPALAPYADTAPPTDAALRAGFAAVALAARSASRPELAHESIYDRAVARLQQAITVRKGDTVLVGDPAAGILARAQDAISRDDLPAALAAVDALQGPAALAAKPWADQLRGVLAARAALSTLMAQI